MDKNSSSYKGILIFLIIFAIIAITFTIWFAKQQNTEIENNDSEPENSNEILEDSPEDSLSLEEKQKFVINDINESYYTNNIEIKELKHQSNDEVEIIDYNEKTEKLKKLDITYFSIDGLKNEEIENKINNEIKRAVFEESIENDSKCRSKQVSYTIGANFANILSFSIDTIWYTGNYKWNTLRDQKYFNYNLVTGEQVELEDLFISMYPIKEKINMVAENYYSWDEPIGEWYLPEEYIQYINKELNLNLNYDDFWNGESENIYKIIDEVVKEGKVLSLEDWQSWYFRSARDEKKLKVIQAFDNGKYTFIIKNTCIDVCIDGLTASVYLLPNMEYLTLYKIFLTDESVFTNEYDNSKKIPYKLYESDAQRCGYVEDNIILIASYADYNIYYSTEEEIKGYEKVSKAMQEKIDALQEYLKHDEKNIYIISVNVGGYPNIFHMLKISKEDFNMQKNFIMNEFIDLDINYDAVGRGFYYNYNSLDSSGIKYKVYYDLLFVYGEEEIEFNYTMYNTNLSNEIIKVEDLKWWNKDTLNHLYNEVFAYHGHDFKNEELRDYFLEKIWYKPIKGKTVSIDELTDIEYQNLMTIKNKINEL